MIGIISALSWLPELEMYTATDNYFINLHCFILVIETKGEQMNYIEALEKAIILLIDNPNISDEAGGYSDCGIVDNDKEIAETLQQLRNQMAREVNK